MPEDIHSILWSKIMEVIDAGKFAVTKEIYDELVHLPGMVGDCIKNARPKLQLEVGEEEWDWPSYLKHVERMRVQYKEVISEYNGNRKGTVGLNDISIIALSNTLKLPVVSMERMSFQGSATKMRIPQVCHAEGIEHLDFNQFLRAAGIKS
jgi:hypothetical protein